MLAPIHLMPLARAYFAYGLIQAWTSCVHLHTSFINFINLSVEVNHLKNNLAIELFYYKYKINKSKM
jgi:hypothetical protein